jgi:hypothetical protein
VLTIVLLECSFDAERDAKAKFQRFVLAVEAAKAKAKAALEDMYTASATHGFQLLGRKISDLCKQWAINLKDKRLNEVILRRSTLGQMLTHEAQLLLGAHCAANAPAGGHQQPNHPAAVLAAAQVQAQAAAAAAATAAAGGDAAAAALFPGGWKMPQPTTSLK